MNAWEPARGDPWPVRGILTSVKAREACDGKTLAMETTTKKRTGMLNSAWLKWTALPLLAFLVGGLVTRTLVPVRRAVDSGQVVQTVGTSLKKLDSGDRAGGLEGLVRAGKMAPDNLAVQGALIGNFQALGEYKLAAQAIERLLRAKPKERQTVQNYAGLCEYLLNHDDPDNAKRILSGDLLARWPDALETAYVQGLVTLQGATRKDDIAAAAKQLQKCVALDPGHVPSKLQLGIADERLGELDQAEALLRAVLEKRPVDPVVLYHLGEVLRQQGKTAEATKYLDEHQRVSPLQQRRQYLEAQCAIQKCQPADLLELGRIYGQLGEFDKAAIILRAYTRRNPADADGQRELAQVCLKLNEKAGTVVAVDVEHPAGTTK